MRRLCRNLKESSGRLERYRKAFAEKCYGTTNVIQTSRAVVENW